MQFQGGSFFVHEGMPYCEIHYHAKRGSLCAGCHKPITGEFQAERFKIKKEGKKPDDSSYLLTSFFLCLDN